MIQIRAEVTGEPHVPPFSVVFEYRDKSDERV